MNAGVVRALHIGAKTLASRACTSGPYDTDPSRRRGVVVYDEVELSQPRRCRRGNDVSSISRRDVAVDDNGDRCLGRPRGRRSYVGAAGYQEG